ncbi:uncharacterized protein CCOS01_03666, partial [Colletotrichum costaricense]
YGGTSEDLPVRAWCLVCFGVSGVRNPDCRPDSKASPRHPPPSPGCLALHDSGTGHRCPGPWDHGKTAEVDEDPTIRVRLSDTRGPPSSQWTLIHWRIRLRRLSKCRLPSSIGSRRRSHSQSHRWKQYSVPGYHGSHTCKPWSDACNCSVKEEEEERAKRITIKVLPCGWNARKTGDGRAIPSDSDKHSPNSTTTPHTLVPLVPLQIPGAQFWPISYYPRGADLVHLHPTCIKPPCSSFNQMPTCLCELRILHAATLRPT